MSVGSFRIHIEEVFGLLKQHSERNRSQKPATAPWERFFGWLTLAGGLIFAGAEVLRQVGDMNDQGVQMIWLPLAICGLLLFSGGAVAGIVQSIRTTRHPFVEHVDRIMGAFDREYELIAALERFETVTLQFARQQLQLQSSMVSSKLSLIGGEGLKTSFVGVAMLAGALLFEYEPAIHGWTMKALALLGVALLLGLSLGGLFARYGASQADYYSGIIGLALERKASVANKPRKVFRNASSRK